MASVLAEPEGWSVSTVNMRGKKGKPGTFRVK